MKTIIGAILLLALTACAQVKDNTPPRNYSYTGADAGFAVIGMGATSKTDYSSYSLLFHKMDSADVAARFTYRPDQASLGTPEYKTAAERGMVQVVPLPPGKYELYNYDVFLNMGVGRNHYSAPANFSIPFTITAGQFTYLGNYQANQINGNNVLGIQIPAGVVFVVEDREERDIQLAKKMWATLGSSVVSDATPTKPALNNPSFIVRR